MNQQRTFAQVVRDGNESASKKVVVANTVDFQVAVDSTKWLEDCFVGRLFELKNVQSIKESFILKKIVAGNKDLLDGLFESLSLGTIALWLERNLFGSAAEVSHWRFGVASVSNVLGLLCVLVREEESEESLDEFGGVGSVNSMVSELGEGFESKEGEEKPVQFPVEVKGSLLGGEGGTCKNNHGGKNQDMIGGVGDTCISNCNINCGVKLSSMGEDFSRFEKEWFDDVICIGPILAQERHACRVGKAPATATAAMCVFAREVAGEEATRHAVFCGGSGTWSARQSEGLTLSDRVGGRLLCTPPSALGGDVAVGVDNLGWRGDKGGCEGVGLINGKEDGRGAQNSGAVANGRRGLSGSGNAVLIPSSSNSVVVRQVDGGYANCKFNRAPLVSFGGLCSQSRALLDTNASCETIVPLSLECGLESETV
ncbi:hypothetical protein VNO80_25824 [Phaseolus coccineus]|uniref:Uncharacterized protein n=1 Tax=Phaseolus coccineus TaxID=3886 RepID=A0AAN9LZB7_PHACN